MSGPYLHLEAARKPVTAVHVQAQDLLVVDRILEPQTAAKFFGFAFGNPLPNGTRPSIPTLVEEELAILYGSYPPDSNGKSIMDRIMARIGSDEDSGRLCGVGKNIQSLKSRLWEGITPLSDQRWQEKELHLQENFDQACQHLSAVLAVFEYLNTQRVQENLRVTFNLIYDLCEELEKVINKRRTETGVELVSVASLWTMYMTAHLEVVTQRAHKWVTQHVDSLRAPLMQELLSYQSSFEGIGIPDSRQWQLMDALHVLLEISVRADYNIMIPMEGYKGYVPPGNSSGPPELYTKDVTERGPVYSQRVKHVSHQIMAKRIIEKFSCGDKSKQTSGESYHDSAMDQLIAQEQARREMRGDSIDATLQEPWIVATLARMEYLKEIGSFKVCGLAIYRLTYGQSEQEWKEFVQNLETSIFAWGAGQTGSDTIKPYLKLHWIDGKELGFAEGDTEAAKRHFNETFNDNSAENESKIPLVLQLNTFLVIDSASFASYTTKAEDPTSSGMLPGDSTGFVLAVDPAFDPVNGISRPDESPDYNGHMRILGGLVWGDLYAQLKSQSTELDDLWPLAMHHPNQVYVGPVTPLQVLSWQK
ncbi:MAP kinase kinase PBS2 [Penicillium atrosanguineum]|uniref:MAP kinase kinase PBS2 n=1 Tax=Penicillium atrosanguineum TaxID=1132637 RepID=UPI0023854414|nr:MAP kinase kinase PBS2 [Penicillium atrosanguineum]KAJ5314578.1 MAP kinase kinase PBS2 [Penicillium atrosanguineum]